MLRKYVRVGEEKESDENQNQLILRKTSKPKTQPSKGNRAEWRGDPKVSYQVWITHPDDWVVSKVKVKSN